MATQCNQEQQERVTLNYQIFKTFTDVIIYWHCINMCICYESQVYMFLCFPKDYIETGCYIQRTGGKKTFTTLLSMFWFNKDFLIDLIYVTINISFFLFWVHQYWLP